MEFRDRLLSTVQTIAPVLEVEGVLIAGSEVPNLLEPRAASTLVVSQDLDVAIPISRHAEVKARLATLHGFAPAPEEPSVWLPHDPRLLEVNFIGMDPGGTDPTSLSVLEDAELPLMVFGGLSLLRPGPIVEVDGARARLPRPAGLIAEKLLTERSELKGARDLLVVLALLLASRDADLEELAILMGTLAPDLRAHARHNLVLLSMATGLPGMPDPVAHRAKVAALLARLEAP